MKNVVVFILTFLPALLMAHSGHGVEDHGGFVHFMLSHGYVVVLAVVVVAFAFFAYRRAQK
jgi:hypothetical protein